MFAFSAVVEVEEEEEDCGGEVSVLRRTCVCDEDDGACRRVVSDDDEKEYVGLASVKATKASDMLFIAALFCSRGAFVCLYCSEEPGVLVPRRRAVRMCPQ